MELPKILGLENIKRQGAKHFKTTSSNMTHTIRKRCHPKSWITKNFLMLRSVLLCLKTDLHVHSYSFKHTKNHYVHYYQKNYFH